MALLIVFLVGIEKISDKVGCQVVAALLHYFTLTFFLDGCESSENISNVRESISKGKSEEIPP